MGKDTTIQWTDSSWNCVRGCRRISPGCENCYAEVIAGRFSGPGLYAEGLATWVKGRGARWTGATAFVKEKLDEPLRWKKPRRIFVNSTSDLFYEDFTNEQIAAVFGIMLVAGHHTFQSLTKRAGRQREWFRWIERHAATVNGEGRPMSPGFACLAYAQKVCDHPALRRIDEIANLYTWPLPNVWLGVSVENQKYAEERIPELLDTPAAVRFVSAEPLLGPLNIANLDDGRGGIIKPLVGLHWEPTSNGLTVRKPPGPGLDWIIVGGESGKKARPFNVSWARSIVGACAVAGVACFVKQVGARPTNDAGTDLTSLIEDSHGGDPAEWPEDLRVREFPEVHP